MGRPRSERPCLGSHSNQNGQKELGSRALEVQSLGLIPGLKVLLSTSVCPSVKWGDQTQALGMRSHSSVCGILSLIHSTNTGHLVCARSWAGHGRRAVSNPCACHWVARWTWEPRSRGHNGGCSGRRGSQGAPGPAWDLWEGFQEWVTVMMRLEG